MARSTYVCLKMGDKGRSGRPHAHRSGLRFSSSSSPGMADPLRLGPLIGGLF